MKIKKGDNVLISKGKDKGRKGKVLRVLPEVGRVVIEGINLKKKHVRPKKSGEKGQIVEIPASIHAANVKLICPRCSKPSRVGYLVKEKGKDRICKRCSQKI